MFFFFMFLLYLQAGGSSCRPFIWGRKNVTTLDSDLFVLVFWREKGHPY